jgi:hypothetical protein
MGAYRRSRALRRPHPLTTLLLRGLESRTSLPFLSFPILPEWAAVRQTKRPPTLGAARVTLDEYSVATASSPRFLSALRRRFRASLPTPRRG